MPPRIAYWTSAFEPGLEAISSEVALLRRHFTSSVSWGMSARHWLLLSRERGYCVHPKLQLLFRGAAGWAQRRFDVNHIFGSPNDWFYLRTARRPVLLTCATFDGPIDGQLIEQVDRFAVEYPGGRALLTQAGVPQERIELIFPPVDLQEFRPGEPPAGEPFTVLFASSPERADWFAARGIMLLLAVAVLRPQIKFRLLWRPWGDSRPAIENLLHELKLANAGANIELQIGPRGSMADEYRRAHAVIAPFMSLERCKPAPNSLIEGFACGRPAICTDVVGLADLIREEQSGVVGAANAEALAEAIDRLQADWPAYSAQARRTAESHFGEEPFITAYGKLYEHLAK